MINQQVGQTAQPCQNSYVYTQPQPNVCPGCGRCRDCGRPYEAQPYPYTPWQITYTTAGGLGAPSAQPDLQSNS